MQGAFFAFAHVQYVTNDVGWGYSSFCFPPPRLWFSLAFGTLVLFYSYAVRENAGTAQLKIRSKMDNVAGVQLPVFESYSEGADGKKTPRHDW